MIDGKTVRRIGERAFEGCSGLTTITLPEDVTRIDPNVFRGCDSLERIIFTGEADVQKRSLADLFQYMNMCTPAVFKALVAAGYFDGVSDNTKASVEKVSKFMYKDRDDILVLLDACGLINPKRIDEYIAYAGEVNAPKSTAFLLKWKKEHVDSAAE